MNSKRKGNAGELELSAFLRENGYPDARRGQQFAGGADSPDVVGGPAGVHIECKRTESLRIYDAVGQAKADAGANIPVVMHRRNRGEWLAILPAKDLLALVARAEEFGPVLRKIAA